MNQDVLELGDELEKFKASTMDLSPPMRGYELGKNRFLRAIHNRFARRVDHLVSDVDLEMDAAKLQNKKTRKKTSFTRTKRKKKRTNSNDEPAFHFVAYIPFGGAVYELDGLNGLPTKLGKRDLQGITVKILTNYLQQIAFLRSMNGQLPPFLIFKLACCSMKPAYSPSTCWLYVIAHRCNSYQRVFQTH